MPEPWKKRIPELLEAGARVEKALGIGYYLPAWASAALSLEVPAPDTEEERAALSAELDMSGNIRVEGEREWEPWAVKVEEKNTTKSLSVKPKRVTKKSSRSGKSGSK